MKYLLLAAVFSLPVQAHQLDQSALAQEAKAHLQPFAAELLNTLKTGLEKGPVNALSACNLQAPSIAQKASSDGWQVGRTSLRTRNIDNRPDDWELETLLQFEQRKKAGEDPATLTASAIVQGEYRFMKAIPTAEMCIACHGSAISTEVQTKLTELYPDDQATGFKVGDLRGAFTLRKVLE